MQGNGHDQNLVASRRDKRIEIGDGFGEHASEDAGRGADLIVFQQMNELTQSAFVAAVSGSFYVGRRRPATEFAESVALAGQRKLDRRRLSRKSEERHQTL